MHHCHNEEYMSPRLHISSKELREALDHWLQDEFVRYPARYRVASIAVKKPKTKRRFVLTLLEIKK